MSVAVLMTIISRLGPATAVKPRRQVADTTVKWDWVDPKQAPLAIFKFTYRSKDALRRECLVPRTPSPELSPGPIPDRSPSPVWKFSPEPDPSVDDLPLEEIRRLAQDRLLDLNVSGMGIAFAVPLLKANSKCRPQKRKRAAEDEAEDEMEAARPVKYIRLSNGQEAIDLTEDD